MSKRSENKIPGSSISWIWNSVFSFTTFTCAQEVTARSKRNERYRQRVKIFLLAPSKQYVVLATEQQQQHCIVKFYVFSVLVFAIFY